MSFVSRELYDRLKISLQRVLINLRWYENALIQNHHIHEDNRDLYIDSMRELLLGVEERLHDLEDVITSDQDCHVTSSTD